MIRVYIASTETKYGYYDSVLWIDNGQDKFLVDFSESTVAKFPQFIESQGIKLAKTLGVSLELVYVG